MSDAHSHYEVEVTMRDAQRPSRTLHHAFRKHGLSFWGKGRRPRQTALAAARQYVERYGDEVSRATVYKVTKETVGISVGSE